MGRCTFFAHAEVTGLHSFDEPRGRARLHWNDCFLLFHFLYAVGGGRSDRRAFHNALTHSFPLLLTQTNKDVRVYLLQRGEENGDIVAGALYLLLIDVFPRVQHLFTQRIYPGGTYFCVHATAESKSVVVSSARAYTDRAITASLPRELLFETVASVRAARSVLGVQ